MVNGLLVCALVWGPALAALAAPELLKRCRCSKHGMWPGCPKHDPQLRKVGQRVLPYGKQNGETT